VDTLQCTSNECGERSLKFCYRRSIGHHREHLTHPARVPRVQARTEDVNPEAKVDFLFDQRGDTFFRSDPLYSAGVGECRLTNTDDQHGHTQKDFIELNRNCGRTGYGVMGGFVELDFKSPVVVEYIAMRPSNEDLMAVPGRVVLRSLCLARYGPVSKIGLKIR
jgi:hypothetical protein